MLPAPCLSVPQQEKAEVETEEVVQPPPILTFSESEKALQRIKWEEELLVGVGEMAGEAARVAEADSHAKVAREELKKKNAFFL